MGLTPLGYYQIFEAEDRGPLAEDGAARLYWHPIDGQPALEILDGDGSGFRFRLDREGATRLAARLDRWLTDNPF